MLAMLRPRVTEHMTDALNEQLSACLDGELPPAELDLLLKRLERDPELRKVYLASIRRSWLIEQPEHSSLFNLIYGASLQASNWPDPSKRPTEALVAPDEYDRDECLAWFRDVPEDTINWTVNNGARQDVTISGMNRFRRPQGRPVLPPSERDVMRWNGDPYVLDGGSEGHSRDDGGAILLPYWMGIWHRLID